MVAKLEDKIWPRLLRQWDDLDPDAARGILQLKFGKSDIARMNRLSARARAGTLTNKEQSELETYMDVGRVIAILQSKARLALKRGKNGSTR
jgi:hypothetical protein